MFIALRDLRRSWNRFLLVGLVVVLVALLTTVLGGLANGLVRDGISGLSALPFDQMAFEHGSKATFSRSTVTDATLSEFRNIPGVQATPVGVSFANAKSEKAGNTTSTPDIDIALFGVEADSFLVERPDARAALAGKPGLVLSGDLEHEGIQVGDRYTFTSSGVTLPVLGFTYPGSYGHVAIAYTSLPTWQKLTYGADAKGRLSAIALQVPAKAKTAAADLAQRTGIELKSKAGTYAGSPGFTAEQTTMSLIRGFLLVISALVVGAFFTVLIVQRTRQVGLLKAMGASTSYVLRDGLAQMIIVVTVATLVGSGIGAGFIAAMSGGSAPIEFVPKTVITGIVLLIVAGVVGSLVPLRRLAGIEPAIALGAPET